MSDTAEITWRVYKQSDMTEGRGYMQPTDELYDSEDMAWAAIGNRGGIQGRTVGRNTYDMDKLKGHNSWREFKEVMGYEGDWAVRPEIVQVFKAPANRVKEWGVTLVTKVLATDLTIDAKSTELAEKVNGEVLSVREKQYNE
jgi:hypothetical protein